MSDDLVKRMKEANIDGYGYLVALLDEGVERIEAQAKTIKHLEDHIAVIRGSMVKGEPIGTVKALQAENAKLRKEIDRLRGPVTYYKKGYGVGDGYAAIQETER